MLNNFIYSKKKSDFEYTLNKGLVPETSIAFIEDTKLIWNHGTYFGASNLINKVNYESDLNNTAEIGSLAMVINPDQLSIKDCYYTEETPKNIHPVNIPYVINKDISNLYNLQLMLCPAGFSSLSDFDEVSDDVRSQMAVIIISEEEGVPVVVYVFMYDPEAPSYLCSGLVDEAMHNQNMKKLNDFISNRNLILYAVDHTVEHPDLVSLTEELIESLDYLLHQINTTGLYFKDHTGWNNISETPKHELSEIKYEPTDFVKSLKDNFGVELELYPDGTPILNASRMVDLLAYLAAAAYVDADSVSKRLATNYYNKDVIDTKLGDINSILESIIGKTMITFTINLTEYQAEEGMVWGTWLNSDLTHPDLDGVTGGTYQDKSGKNLLTADGVLVRNLDLIIEGHEYRLA